MLETGSHANRSLFAEDIVRTCENFASSPHWDVIPAALQLSTHVYDLVAQHFLEYDVSRCVKVLKVLVLPPRQRLGASVSDAQQRSESSGENGDADFAGTPRLRLSSHLAARLEARGLSRSSDSMEPAASKLHSRPLFSVPIMTNAIQDRLRALHGGAAGTDDPLLLINVLIYLYSLAERFDDVVQVYLDERHSLAAAPTAAGGGGSGSGGTAYFFELLAEHDLSHLVARSVTQLVELDSAGAARFMAEHPDEFAIDDVVSQLRPRPAALLAYLHAQLQLRCAAYNVPENGLYHDLQLQ